MTNFKLRPYQVEALEVIHKDLQSDPVVLFLAIMGAGKTVTIGRLINRYWYETDRNFLILAHKQELVEQFFNTFRTKTDIPVSGIGICCAGLNQKNIEKRLTIGTIQTFCNFVDDYQGCDLFVCDEAHHISIGTDSQYDQVIKSLKSKKNNMRILGCTASNSRLGHGYIYGDRHKKSAVNLFPRLNHQIKYERLLSEGYLCEMHGTIANADQLHADLESVAVNGDYILNHLGEIMAKEIHLRTAVEAITQYCGEYHRVCVFACTIDHAEKLHKLIGDEATIIHSKLSPIERAANMEAWKSGLKRICVSINILAEGFDFPPLDCLVFARPTLSSTLYLQALGRALRISPETGKTHAFILDLTENTARFGLDIDKIKVIIPRSAPDLKPKNQLNKICPNCEAEVHQALRVCPECEFEWPPPEAAMEATALPAMGNVTFGPAEPEWVDVIDMHIDMHESKKTIKLLGKITFLYGNEYRPKRISHFLCLPDFYSGYALIKAEKIWNLMSPGTDFPQTVEEFVAVADTVSRPDRILIDFSGEYPEIKDHAWDVPF